MSKPWDKLRNRPTPIRSGEWLTTKNSARVAVDCAGSDESGLISINTHYDVFAAADLRELAEFCTELADQLESQ